MSIRFLRILTLQRTSKTLWGDQLQSRNPFENQLEPVNSASKQFAEVATKAYTLPYVQYGMRPILPIRGNNTPY